jgi:acetyl-CoA acetyltransferase
VIAAALAAGIDCVGINAEAREQAPIEALSDRVERAGLRVLTDAGLIPCQATPSFTTLGDTYFYDPPG